MESQVSPGRLNGGEKNVVCINGKPAADTGELEPRCRPSVECAARNLCLTKYEIPE
jgi:hypothetical protein